MCIQVINHRSLPNYFQVWAADIISDDTTVEEPSEVDKE